MATVSIVEAKAKLSSLIVRVEEEGQPIIITRNGTPVAMLAPIPIIGQIVVQHADWSTLKASSGGAGSSGAAPEPSKAPNPTSAPRLAPQKPGIGLADFLKAGR